jgi:hypothetical protein
MKGLESLRRAVSPEEAGVIGWLIEHGEPGVSEYADTLESLTVVARCTCGCPTVYFEIKGNPATRKGERIISDHLGTVDGQDVGVMLFALGNQLSSLEVYSQAGSDKPFGLPKVCDLYSSEESPGR